MGRILSTVSGLVLERPRDPEPPSEGLNHSSYMKGEGRLGGGQGGNLALISPDLRFLIVSLILW